LHDNPEYGLVPVGFRFPQWMIQKVTEVQRQNHMVSRTEAVRFVMVRGLEALGIDLPTDEGDAA